MAHPRSLFACILNIGRCCQCGRCCVPVTNLRHALRDVAVRFMRCEDVGKAGSYSSRRLLKPRCRNADTRVMRHYRHATTCLFAVRRAAHPPTVSVPSGANRLCTVALARLAARQACLCRAQRASPAPGASPHNNATTAPPYRTSRCHRYALSTPAVSAVLTSPALDTIRSHPTSYASLSATHPADGSLATALSPAVTHTRSHAHTHTHTHKMTSRSTRKPATPINYNDDREMPVDNVLEEAATRRLGLWRVVKILLERDCPGAKKEYIVQFKDIDSSTGELYKPERVSSVGDDLLDAWRGGEGQRVVGTDMSKGEILHKRQKRSSSDAGVTETPRRSTRRHQKMEQSPADVPCAVVPTIDITTSITSGAFRLQMQQHFAPAFHTPANTAGKVEVAVQLPAHVVFVSSSPLGQLRQLAHNHIDNHFSAPHNLGAKLRNAMELKGDLIKVVRMTATAPAIIAAYTEAAKLVPGVDDIVDTIEIEHGITTTSRFLAVGEDVDAFIENDSAPGISIAGAFSSPEP
ncbi:hypothetical protein P153DRAFT_361836 [Dothidotthia symphoricarpi CBS 119687]|uniref:Uncharacterized protein n=1 Tax=Dothidotthia symphoricarpi CBS 119687 TaxID=1392245 RepID=A0A6A5ZZG0_9PLEO|nr:uncharacterized protein P153DRAFT_361836 [Dothidotthia symphoricarpi CBS 119687]KAF2123711.1 hypothetical protein P153DRAFT_361836 [Dothidotthia symphoricarpi CBS 119687]